MSNLGTELGLLSWSCVLVLVIVASDSDLLTVLIEADYGDWPSGKAPGFGPGIRGFESLIPSHNVHQR